jgi:hypothetical protein
MLKAIRLFSEAFLLINFTLKAIKLFEKFYFLNPILKDSQLIKEALYNPNNSSVLIRYLISLNAI